MRYVTPSGDVDRIYDHIMSSPHTLIAGTTGSGKSVLMNNIVRAFMIRRNPNDKLILIDPKKVELSQYKALPHCDAYCDSSKSALKELENQVEEIGKRYKRMQKYGIREWDKGEVFILIDEFADLMISKQSNDIKSAVQNILQIGRAAGVHIIACTQAPNRVVIPASIVLNFTDRVALKCLSPIESRQIIGNDMAVSLNRYGECLYLHGGTIYKVKVGMVDYDEIKKLIEYWNCRKKCIVF